MHYSYFKEPGLDESGYSRGYKTGSMNYLVNGEIEFADSFGYYDGQKDGSHEDGGNSSVYHYQIVNFTGEKGISEFYAKGFYPNNRAVSAWKKIRYDDLNYVMYSGVLHLSGASRIQGVGRSPSYAGSYGLGESRKSNYINVSAYADMGGTDTFLRPGIVTKLYGDKSYGSPDDYEFDYNASIKDGIIEIWDATAWTNRTGSRRIDWEENSLIKGDNISIINDLIAKNMSYPGADLGQDWLSCCIGGGEDLKNDLAKELAEYGDSDNGWPNEGTYMTLKPAQKTPDIKRDRECFIDPEIGILRCTDPPEYEKLNCSYDNCPGFECIYQFEDNTTYQPSPTENDNEPPSNTTGLPFKWNTSIYLTKEIQETKNLSALSNCSFKIILKYLEPGTLYNLTLVDEHPESLVFANSSQKTTENSSTTVTWTNITLNNKEEKTIYVNFTLNGEYPWTDLLENSVRAYWWTNGEPQMSQLVHTNPKPFVALT